MASRPRRPRRLLLAAILGAILAGEITGIALARTLPPVIVPVAAPGPAAAVVRTTDRASERAPATGRDSAADTVHVGVDLGSRRAGSIERPGGTSLATRAQAKTASVRMGGGAPTVRSGGSGGSATNFRGTNHVWIPSLGINRSVQSFPCSRTRPPDAGVYRWGCAGRNNVYLLSHAWSTFRPLHDAYVRGTLRKGMRVWYADSSGRTHEYRVIWWRVTAPTTGASWAWASLSSPGMTLQTCVGANSEYRLMVRLDRVD